MATVIGGLISACMKWDNAALLAGARSRQVANTAPTQTAIATVPAANSRAMPLPMLTTTRLVDAHACECAPNGSARRRSPGDDARQCADDGDDEEPDNTAGADQGPCNGKPLRRELPDREPDT